MLNMARRHCLCWYLVMSSPLECELCGLSDSNFPFTIGPRGLAWSLAHSRNSINIEWMNPGVLVWYIDQGVDMNHFLFLGRIVKDGKKDVGFGSKKSWVWILCPQLMCCVTLSVSWVLWVSLSIKWLWPAAFWGEGEGDRECIEPRANPLICLEREIHKMLERHGLQ